jgi:cell division protease FtsH
MVLKLLDKETLTKADLSEIFASVGKRPSRDYASSRKPPAGRPPVLTPAEIAKLDPKDLAALGHNGNGNGSRSRANGSKSNGTRSNGTGAKSNGGTGAKSNGSRTTASSRSRANQTAKPPAAGRTTRKRTDGRGRQAPGTPA